MLTVVIPTHNRNDLLRRTLLSLAACERPAEYARTIVIENGGRHGAEQVCREAAEWLNVEYMYHEQGNKSAALNAALESIDSGVIVFLDDDVRVDPGLLQAYAAAAADTGSGRFFGGPTSADYEAVPPAWLLPFVPGSVTGLTLCDADETKQSPFLGCNWAAFAGDLRSTGGFDAAVGPGGLSGGVGQEANMQRRLSTAGIAPKIVPSALVWHFVPRHRCSPKWALHRVYRQGITYGLSHRHAGPRLFGDPRWMLRVLLQRGLRVAISRISLDRRSKFQARYEFSQMCGILRGIRQLKAESSAAGPEGDVQLEPELQC